MKYQNVIFLKRNKDIEEVWNMIADEKYEEIIRFLLDMECCKGKIYDIPLHKFLFGEKFFTYVSKDKKFLLSYLIDKEYIGLERILE